MLPLKPLSIISPRTITELSNEISSADHRSKIMAGGTDLLPNLKHGLYDIDQIISLRKLDELRRSFIDNRRLTIGALFTLNDLATPLIRDHVPALARAGQQIASPQIRNMGTVGGNIALDTRCLYINQTQFWRSSLGYCLKKDGVCCHVVPTGKRCVAAASNDVATVLLALDGEISIAQNGSFHSMLLSDFYTADGKKNNSLTPQQIITSVSLNLDSFSHAGFFKLRFRSAIDFPILSTAVAFTMSSSRKLTKGKIVINALVAKPKIIDLNEYHGMTIENELIENIAKDVEQKCHPQTNITSQPAYRKSMIPHTVKQAFLHALNPIENL